MLAFLVLMLIVASYTLVKSVRDAVFLSRFGVREISFVALGLAALAGVVAGLHERIAARLSKAQLIAASHLLIATTLVGLWTVLRADEPPAVARWALYVWSSLFGVFIVTQFWQLTSDLFDVRQAKRVFPWVGAGAIVGGLVGGAASPILAGRMPAESLLLVAAGMLLVATALTGPLWQRRLPVETGPKRSRRSVATEPVTLRALLSRPSFVRAMAVSLLLATVATTLIDWQLKTVAKHVFAGRTNDMAAFFGSVFALQSAASLVLQLVVTGWLFRTFGIATGRAALPVVVLFGSLAVVAHELLPFALLMALAGTKVAEGGARFAINRAALELTWLSLSAEERARSKSFIDTVVDRLGTGVTGLLWLGLASFGFDRPDRVHLIGFVVLAAGVLWLLATRATQRHYVAAFRKSLEQRELDFDAMAAQLGTEEAQRRLSGALESDDPQEILFGLHLLTESDAPLPSLQHLLEHEAADVRLGALELLVERDDDAHALEGLLDDPDPRVREAATRRLGKRGTSVVADADSPTAQLVVALDDEAGDAEREIQRRLEAGPELEDVRLLGAAAPAPAARLLGPLLTHDEPAVVREVLDAAGRAGAVDLAGQLAGMMETRAHRAPAGMALAAMGPAALEVALEALEPSPARHALLRWLGASGDARFVAPLQEALGAIASRSQALASLIRLRLALPDAEVDAAIVDATLDTELTALWRALGTLRLGGLPRLKGAKHDDLLARTLHEDAEERVRRCFGLLALRHDPRALRDAYVAVRSERAESRARALELLDNMLARDVRERLVPALDDLDRKALAAAGRRFPALAPRRRRDVLGELLEAPEAWLRAVACRTVGEARMADLGEAVERLLEPSDDWIASEAKRALARLDGDGAEAPDVSLTVVDKALALRSVDVLSEVPGKDLALVAQVAEVEEVEADQALYEEGDAPDALYVILEGEVALSAEGAAIGTATAGEAFGAWALVDDSPRTASARSVGACRLLTVHREDFAALLADRPDMVQSVFKAMVQRIRALAALAKTA